MSADCDATEMNRPTSSVGSGRQLCSSARRQPRSCPLQLRGESLTSSFRCRCTACRRSLVVWIAAATLLSCCVVAADTPPTSASLSVTSSTSDSEAGARFTSGFLHPPRRPSSSPRSADVKDDDNGESIVHAVDNVDVQSYHGHHRGSTTSRLSTSTAVRRRRHSMFSSDLLLRFQFV